jgi:hypothetical protein
MCSLTIEYVLLHRICSLTIECALLLENGFSYYRMCSLTIECVLLHVVVEDTANFGVKILCY